MASSKTDLVVGLVMLDKFSKTFDKFNRDMAKGQSASKSFGNALGGIGIGLSVAAVGAFGMASVKAYGDALQSQQRLTDAFAKQPQLMGYNVAALMEYNKTLSTKIAYDDDEINAAQANLALFKLTGDQIKSLTPLVADLARRKGIDLASAATSVGKAMQGQARGLKDLGINFKATGDTAADYAAITALLNQQVGGTAEAFAQGNPLGQLANAKIAFDNMQESVGKALLPAMTALTNIMTPLANALGAIPTPIMQIGIVIGGAILAGRLLGPTMMGAFTAMRSSALAASASVAMSTVATEEQGVAAVTSSGAMRVFAASTAVAGTAARGLLTAMGGGIGLAIMAVATAVSFFVMKSDEAAVSTDDWTASLSKQNGVLDENSKRIVAQKLADEGILDSITRLKDAGVDLPDYMSAISGTEQDRMMMIAQLKQIIYLHSGLGADGQMAYDMTATAAQKAIDALKLYGPQIGAVSTLTGDAGAIFGAMAGATDAAAAGLDNVSTQASKTQQSLGLMSAELSDAIMAFYSLQMPGRDVAGGESIEQWAARVKIYEDSLRGIVPTVEDATTSTSGLSDATTTLTDNQQRALDKANRLGEALRSITAERDSFVAGINDASLSFTSIFGFDIKGGVAASQAVTDALQTQAEARAALAAIGPGDDDARAKAQQNLAAATRDVADAETASAAAQATGANVLGSYKGRLAKLQRFSRVMASLAKKGLSALIYQDILGQGIDGGLEMAQAINGDKALIGQLNTTADSIARSTSGMAARAGNYVYGGYVGDAQRRADRGAAAATALGTTPDAINVTLKLDSATVYKQLLRLKRERGGQSLGV